MLYIDRINRNLVDKCCENKLRYPRIIDFSSGQRYPSFKRLGLVQATAGNIQLGQSTDNLCPVADKLSPTLAPTSTQWELTIEQDLAVLPKTKINRKRCFS